MKKSFSVFLLFIWFFSSQSFAQVDSALVCQQKHKTCIENASRDCLKKYPNSMGEKEFTDCVEPILRMCNGSYANCNERARRVERELMCSEMYKKKYEICEQAGANWISKVFQRCNDMAVKFNKSNWIIKDSVSFFKVHDSLGVYDNVTKKINQCMENITSRYASGLEKLYSIRMKCENQVDAAVERCVQGAGRNIF